MEPTKPFTTLAGFSFYFSGTSFGPPKAFQTENMRIAGLLQYFVIQPIIILRTRTQFGRQFSDCGPDVWNSLPPFVHTVDSDLSFCHALKTHVFQLAFNN